MTCYFDVPPSPSPIPCTGKKKVSSTTFKGHPLTLAPPPPPPLDKIASRTSNIRGPSRWKTKLPKSPISPCWALLLPEGLRDHDGIFWAEEEVSPLLHSFSPSTRKRSDLSYGKENHDRPKSRMPFWKQWRFRHPCLHLLQSPCTTAEKSPRSRFMYMYIPRSGLHDS